MIDFAVALTSLTKAWEALKAIQEIDKNLDAATYKAKIAELMGAVADAKFALVEARLILPSARGRSMASVPGLAAQARRSG